MTMIEPYIDVALALTAMTLVILHLRGQREAKRLKIELNTMQEHLCQTQRDFTALLRCSQNIGQRVGDAEQIDRRLQQQIDQLNLARHGDQVAVEHAMKLLASGHELAEVTSICELSEGEVEILANLNRFQSAA